MESAALAASALVNLGVEIRTLNTIDGIRAQLFGNVVFGEHL
jgi:hypothetical protein